MTHSWTLIPSKITTITMTVIIARDLWLFRPPFLSVNIGLSSDESMNLWSLVLSRIPSETEFLVLSISLRSLL